MSKITSFRDDSTIDQEERAEILRLARQLPHRNPVRQFALALLEDRPEETGSYLTLLEVLVDPSEGRWQERTVAAWALGRARMAPQTSATAAQVLGDIVTNWQVSPAEQFLVRGLRAFGRLALVWLGLVLLSILLSLVRFLLSLLELPPPLLISDDHLLFSTLISCVYMLPFASFTLDARRNNRLRRIAVRSLGRLTQPLSVGVLAWAIMNNNAQLSKEAEHAILNVLPTLSPEQYGTHDRETVPRLCQLVSCDTYAPVPWLQVLTALAEIGDGRAIQPVEWIIKHHGRDEIGLAASAVLPILRERRQRENDSTHLVRAASAPADPSDCLVRPAQDIGSAEAQLLLRSTFPGENGG